MVVWLKPCKSRSLPGAFTETLQPSGLGGFFFSGHEIRLAAELVRMELRPWHRALGASAPGCRAAAGRCGEQRRFAWVPANQGMTGLLLPCDTAEPRRFCLAAPPHGRIAGTPQQSTTLDDLRRHPRSSQMRNSVSRLFNGIFTSRPRTARRIPCERGLRLWGGCSLEPEQSGGS